MWACVCFLKKTYPKFLRRWYPMWHVEGCDCLAVNRLLVTGKHIQTQKLSTFSLPTMLASYRNWTSRGRRVQVLYDSLLSFLGVFGSIKLILKLFLVLFFLGPQITCPSWSNFLFCWILNIWTLTACIASRFSFSLVVYVLIELDVCSEIHAALHFAIGKIVLVLCAMKTP